MKEEETTQIFYQKNWFYFGFSLVIKEMNDILSQGHKTKLLMTPHRIVKLNVISSILMRQRSIHNYVTNFSYLLFKISSQTTQVIFILS